MPHSETKCWPLQNGRRMCSTFNAVSVFSESPSLGFHTKRLVQAIKNKIYLSLCFELITLNPDTKGTVVQFQERLVRECFSSSAGSEPFFPGAVSHHHHNWREQANAQLGSAGRGKAQQCSHSSSQTSNFTLKKHLTLLQAPQAALSHFSLLRLLPFSSTCRSTLHCPAVNWPRSLSAGTSGSSLWSCVCPVLPCLTVSSSAVFPATSPPSPRCARSPEVRGTFSSKGDEKLEGKTEADRGLAGLLQAPESYHTYNEV